MAGRFDFPGRVAVAAALAWVSVLAAAPAWAVNKCVGEDGRVTYTDSPCAGGSRTTRIDTPPPLTREEQAEARARSERIADDARELEARQAAEAAARQRRSDAERAAERAAEERRARQEAQREEAERWVVRPVLPRYWPAPAPVLPRPKPPEPERPQPMRAYPFR